MYTPTQAAARPPQPLQLLLPLPLGLWSGCWDPDGNLGRGLSHWDFLGLQVEFQVEVHPPDGSSDFLYHGGPNISFQVAGVSFIGESNGPQFLRDTFEIYKKS